MLLRNYYKCINHSTPHYNVVAKLLDLRFNDITKSYEVLTKWKGFDHEDPGWEPFSVLAEDIPDMLDRFLSALPDQALVRKARHSVESH